MTDTNLAFVFPGQGSQSLGMLAELAELHPQIREAFTEASDGAGVDLWALSQGGPEEMLNRTEYTQPALLAASIGVWRAWNAVGGPRPSVLAGHSLGEYTALVAAGALSLRDGAHLVRLRGQLMQEAAPTGVGAMAAVLGAKHRSHGADASRSGFLHQLAAQAHQVGTVMQRQRTGGDQRGVFAQAVPGQHGRLRAMGGLPGTPDADAGGQQRRLRVFGAVEHFLRTTLRQRPQVDTGAIGGFREGRADLRVQLGQFGEHAQRLRALAREHECEIGIGHAIIRLQKSNGE